VPDHQRALGVEVGKATVERHRLLEAPLQHPLQLPGLQCFAGDVQGQPRLPAGLLCAHLDSGARAR
jgi:hypothetical protein